MATLLGLVAALTYGSADFVGGLASKRSSAGSVVVVSQLAGGVVLAAALLLLPPATLSARALWFGAAAGVTGGAGVLLLYRALAVGRMSVVAPVTAVEAATVPVAVGLLLGERPAALAVVGVVVALVAIVLVSSVPQAAGDADRSATAPPGRPGLVDALGAGLAFGLFFVVFDQIPAAAGLWPLVVGRVVSMALVAALTLLTGQSLRPRVGTVRLIVGAGVLDMVANVLYLLATQRGLLSVVAVLVSLYPASTVVLARIVLRERLARPQIAGLGAAAAGVALIAAA